MNQSSSPLGSSLIKTSYLIPQLQDKLLTRSILIEKMNRALHFPLTLISAPAGSGKTTLLSQWIYGSNDGDLLHRTAWISVESEWDLRQFWTYISAAIVGTQPGIVEPALELLGASQLSIHAILRTLINGISAFSGYLILVLDDYHQVSDPTIHASLTYFINHLPPNLHLVIASRSQVPFSLSRRRANHMLFELRESDLRFTLDEITTFFNDIKGLDLSIEEITALGARTEGWIAGLQLIALSMEGIDDTSKRSFVSAFTGSQQYIMDYLVEEVLQRQPDTIRSFLLRTSVLERLNAALCNTVTGQMNGQAILEQLERAHIFTIPLDHEQRWFRYHHLFRDVLYHRLSQAEPENLLDLHHRAATWYIQAGNTEDAIRHACAAQEWDLAVGLIEPGLNTIWNRGEVHKIITWLGRLPDEYLVSRPDLYLYYLRALLHGGQMEAAERRLRKAEAEVRIRKYPESSVDMRLLLGTICALRTTIAAVSDEPDKALALGHEALSLLPPEKMDIQAYAMNSLGVAHYYLGNTSNAVQALAEGGELAQKAGNIFSMVAAIGYQAKALICQGKLNRARQILDHALNLSNRLSPGAQSKLTATGLAQAILGYLLYEWNLLEDAEQCLTEAIESGQQLAYGSALWSAYHTLARIKIIQGDQKGAEFLIKQAHRHRSTYTMVLPGRLMDADEARISLAMGKLDSVERWARTHLMDGQTSSGLVQEFENMILARFYLLQNQPWKALTLLEQINSKANTGGRKGHVIEILVLSGLAQQALGELQLAENTIHTALSMAYPEGYMRIFVDEGQPMAALLARARTHGIMQDYIGRLLAAFPGGDSLAPPTSDDSQHLHKRQAHDHLIEPLTQRELEVLQLIANGSSNQDIAKELIVAPTTAKKHVSNIIQKLGAKSRTQAVAVGRNLGLCE